MLLSLKRSLGGMCHASHQYAKTNDKYMKEYDENKESAYHKYWYVNNLFGWQCCKSFQ